jgi:serine phosphatase RsbU (regulator of sigma subunit)
MVELTYHITCRVDGATRQQLQFQEASKLHAKPVDYARCGAGGERAHRVTVDRSSRPHPAQVHMASSSDQDRMASVDVVVGRNPVRVPEPILGTDAAPGPGGDPSSMSPSSGSAAPAAPVGLVGLAALGQMAASASGATEVGEVLRVGASLLADTLTASHAAVFEHHEAAGVLQCRVGVLNGVLASDSGAALLRLPTGRESMPGYTLLAGRTVVTTDLLADRRFVALAPALGVFARSAVNVPLGWPGHWWGVLGVYGHDTRVWTEGDVAMVEAVAAIMAGLLRATASELSSSRFERYADLATRASGMGRWSWNAARGEITLDEIALSLFDPAPDPSHRSLHGRTETISPGSASDRLGSAETGEVRSNPFEAGSPTRTVGVIDTDSLRLQVHPADRARVVAAAAQAVRDGDAFHLTFRLLDGDDGRLPQVERWVECLGQACPEEADRDGVQCMVGVVADVTGRRLRGENQARLAMERMARMRAEEVVESLQSTLLPGDLPDDPVLAFAARYQVASPHSAVGGDFYDVIDLEGTGWGVVVGDVCGRGHDAAALAGVMRHSVRATAINNPCPGEVLARTNRAVIDQMDDFRFATATYLHATADPAAVAGAAEGARRAEGLDKAALGVSAVVAITVSSAGHPRPVLVRADGRVEVLDCGGVALGVVAEPTFTEVVATLDPGDSVVLYTDGVTDARGPDGLFGQDRLLAVLASMAGRTPDSIVGALDDAVRRHRAGADDDMAVVVVQIRNRADLVDSAP